MLPGFDAWLTREPDYGSEVPLPGDPFYPRCSGCGAFLKLQAERTEGQTETRECDGRTGEYEAQCGDLRRHDAHSFIAHAWEVLYRTCKRCGHINQEVSA